MAAIPVAGYVAWLRRLGIPNFALRREHRLDAAAEVLDLKGLARV